MEKKQAASVVTGHWFANSENCEHGSRQIACVGTQGHGTPKFEGRCFA